MPDFAPPETIEVNCCPVCGEVLALKGYQGYCRNHPESLRANTPVAYVRHNDATDQGEDDAELRDHGR